MNPPLNSTNNAVAPPAPAPGTVAPFVAPADAPAETSKRSGGPTQKGGKGQVSNTKFIASVLGVLLILVFAWRMRPKAKEAKGPLTKAENYQLVQTVSAKIGDLAQVLPVTGTLRTNFNINLSAKAPGRVERIWVEEGQRVKRGQLLVTLEDAELRSQVGAARAALSTSQVRLRQQNVGLDAKIADVNSSILDARANLGGLRASFRAAQLQEPARITGFRSEVETARQAVNSAQAQVDQARQSAAQTSGQVAAAIRRTKAALDSAKASLSETVKGSRDQEIAQAVAEVNVLLAQLANSETELKRAKELVRVGASAQSVQDAAQTDRDVFKAQLDRASQNLSLVREGRTPQAVRVAQEAVDQAQAQLADALATRRSITVARGEVTNLLAALARSQETLRKARANLADIPAQRQQTRVAAQAVRQGEATLSRAIANRSDIPVAREEIEAARAGVQSSQAAFDEKLVTLANARIFSPIDGVVNLKNTAQGESVGIGATLLNIVATDSVFFEAQVDENDVRRIRIGFPVRVDSAAVSDKPLRGIVSDVIAVANSDSRQFRVRVSLQNAPNLTPGAFARGEIVTRQVTGALLVPTDSIRRTKDKSQILIAPGGESAVESEVRDVKTGLSAGEMTQILGGIEAGDRVIVGNPALKTDTPVRVAKPKVEAKVEA